MPVTASSGGSRERRRSVELARFALRPPSPKRLCSNEGSEMLAIWSANLKEGKEKEYKDWVSKNLKPFVKNLPPGWTFRGVYGGSLGPPDVCWVYGIKKYADLDRMTDYENEVINRVNAEEKKFLIAGTAKVTLMTEIEKWSVQAPRKPKKK